MVAGETPVFMSSNLYVGFFHTHKPTVNDSGFSDASFSLVVSADSVEQAFPKLKTLLKKMHAAVNTLASGGYVYLHEVISLKDVPEEGSVLRYETQNPSGFLITASLLYPTPNPLQSYETDSSDGTTPFFVLPDLR